MDHENRFADLLEAARSLIAVGSVIRIEGPPTDDQLRDFCNANAGSLDAARKALAESCFPEYDPAKSWDDPVVRELACLRNLARALDWKSRLAVRWGRFDEAVTYALDLIRLGNASRRGGRITEMLIAIAFTGMGIDRLGRMRHALDASTCARGGRELVALSAESEPYEIIEERDAQVEQDFAASSIETEPPTGEDYLPPMDRLDTETASTVTRAVDAFIAMPRTGRVALFRESDQRALAQWRLLSTELALRAYHGRHATLPHDLNQLVPDLLPEVPVDPYSGAALRYRCEESEYWLYSVGPSGRDKGGRLGSRTEVQNGIADLFLDYSDVPNPVDLSNLRRMFGIATWRDRLRLAIRSWIWKITGSASNRSRGAQRIH